MNGLSLLAMLGLVAGCQTDNDGDDNNSILTGQFLDSAVAGLKYESGSQSGKTDSTGGFSYEEGQVVVFSIGPVIIGECTGKDFITPVDLVSGAVDASNDTVLNITRFLLTLDNDDEPENGTEITTSVYETIDSLGFNLDFSLSLSEFENQENLQQILAAIGKSSLYATTAAKKHLTLTLSELQLTITENSTWDFNATSTYDDFSGSQLNVFKWFSYRTGSDAELSQQDGSITLKPVRSSSDTVISKVSLDFDGSIPPQLGFQGMEAEVTISDSSGDSSENYVSIGGEIYNTDTRQTDSSVNEIMALVMLEGSGKVFFYIMKCMTEDCAYTEDDVHIPIFLEMHTIADPVGTAHIMAIGFDDENIHFRFNDTKTSVAITELHPKTTDRWYQPHIMTRAGTDGTAGYINVDINTVKIGNFNSENVTVPAGTVGDGFTFTSSSVYDDFSSGDVSTDNWYESTRGANSSLTVQSQVLVASASQLASETSNGRAKLGFVDATCNDNNFDGFQLDFKITNSTGSDYGNWVNLSGEIYNTGTRSGDPDDMNGEVNWMMSILASGKVYLNAAKCTDYDCDSETLIRELSFFISDPLQTTHTAAIGFDGTNAKFRIGDFNGSFPITDSYPVGTENWFACSFSSRASKTDTEGSITVEFDNTVTGSF